MFKKGLVVLLILALAGGSWFFWQQQSRETRLNAWAESVPLSDRQRTAMETIWAAYLAGKPPARDPLDRLTQEDRQYLRKISSDLFRPAEFGEPEPFPERKYERLRDKGFTPHQIEIIMGMIQNRVGRPDL